MRSIVSLKEYLKNPCQSLSIPYWKTKITSIPDSIDILHHSEFKNQYKSFQKYFRLLHNLEEIEAISNLIEPLELNDNLVRVMNTCFKNEHIELTLKDLKDMQLHPTYRDTLWIGIKADTKLIGCAIAEYDLECREGSIEWVCVLPEYHRKGYGSKLINGLLYKLKELGADFVTVSGRVGNLSHPEEFYRACGFTGSDIWYICMKENV